MLRASVWSCWLGGKYVDRKALESLHCEHCSCKRSVYSHLCVVLAISSATTYCHVFDCSNPANKYCLQEFHEDSTLPYITQHC